MSAVSLDKIYLKLVLAISFVPKPIILLEISKYNAQLASHFHWKDKIYLKLVLDIFFVPKIIIWLEIAKYNCFDHILICFYVMDSCKQYSLYYYDISAVFIL